MQLQEVELLQEILNARPFLAELLMILQRTEDFGLFQIFVQLWTMILLNQTARNKFMRHLGQLQDEYSATLQKVLRSVKSDDLKIQFLLNQLIIQFTMGEYHVQVEKHLFLMPEESIYDLQDQSTLQQKYEIFAQAYAQSMQFQLIRYAQYFKMLLDAIIFVDINPNVRGYIFGYLHAIFKNSTQNNLVWNSRGMTQKLLLLLRKETQVSLQLVLINIIKLNFRSNFTVYQLKQILNHIQPDLQDQRLYQDSALLRKLTQPESFFRVNQSILEIIMGFISEQNDYSKGGYYFSGMNSIMIARDTRLPQKLKSGFSVFLSFRLESSEDMRKVAQQRSMVDSIYYQKDSKCQTLLQLCLNKFQIKLSLQPRSSSTSTGSKTGNQYELLLHEYKSLEDKRGELLVYDFTDLKQNFLTLYVDKDRKVQIFNNCQRLLPITPKKEQLESDLSQVNEINYLVLGGGKMRWEVGGEEPA